MLINMCTSVSVLCVVCVCAELTGNNSRACMSRDVCRDERFLLFGSTGERVLKMGGDREGEQEKEE